MYLRIGSSFIGLERFLRFFGPIHDNSATDILFAFSKYSSTFLFSRLNSDERSLLLFSTAIFFASNFVLEGLEAGPNLKI